ncbi:sulfotransferase [Hydrocarboniphaga sp.]|uniref:sulfotransferase family protein n=1 Tax=Hydrocarboniphaga sp. TaxID=2033016 RepID=UPI00261DCEC6|nr:sulfotransferase [Hydrocarboniphaga sp.]
MSAAVRNFEPEALLAEASAVTGGLSNFGDASFRPGLDQLCESLDGEARLSPTGVYLMRMKVVGQLVNRLKVEDWFKRHPEIAGELIAAPVVIVGLPRTGTTKLHRLLSRDPRFYWMAWWEAIYPVPFDNETLQQPSARIAQAHADVRAMTDAMPKLAAMHPMDADAADEEVMLMEHSFLSAFNAYADVPGYMAWMDTQDQRPAYTFLKRMLQFLQWQKRQRGIVAQRWVLKAPHHLLRMDVLLAEFPGVRVIQTHRDPTSSIPSIGSFIHTLWCIYSDQAAAAAAGGSWNELMRRALNHTMQVRDRGDGSAFFDVRFVDTVKNPMDVVARVYDFLGWSLPAELAASMRNWLAEDEKAHQGGHAYTAQQFGLSDEQIRRDFAAYIERHLS